MILLVSIPKRIIRDGMKYVGFGGYAVKSITKQYFKLHPVPMAILD
jgi:hypothetical protein